MQNRARQIEKAITGILQLCLARHSCVVWVEQLDAAAFSDGFNVYLPRPTGLCEGEFDLLLALALREVARIKYSDAGRFRSQDGEVPFADVVEDVRVKQAIKVEYRGAPEIFRQAYSLSEGLLAQECSALNAAALSHRLVYLAANDALHGLDYRHKLDPETFRDGTGLPEDVRLSVTALASESVQVRTTDEAFDLAQQIGLLLQQQAVCSEPEQGGQP